MFWEGLASTRSPARRVCVCARVQERASLLSRPRAEVTALGSGKVPSNRELRARGPAVEKCMKQCVSEGLAVPNTVH